MAKSSKKGWAEPATDRKVSELKPYEHNPRIHPKEQIALLAALLTRWGPDQPIVVDENDVILKGHGRRLAAIEAGLSLFPVVKRIGLSEDDKKAIRIADNQSALLSSWDQTLVQYEVKALVTNGFKIDLLGFSTNLLDWATSDGSVVNDPGAEWAGMPQFAQVDKTAFRSIVVHFKDQEAVDLFQKKLGIALSDSARFLHYPQIEIEPFKDKRYASKKK